MINKENTGIIIQARLGSTRLPGKVLLPLGDKTVLEFMIKRLSHAGFPIYLALADEEDDRSLIELAGHLQNRNEIKGYFIGSVDNVYKRTVDCAEVFSIEHIIDITSDCPFADPELVEDMFRYYQTGKWDYISNVEERTFADGFDVQIYSAESLKNAPVKNKDHSGWNIMENYDYKKLNITAPFDSYAPDLRITLDTIQDYSIISRVYGYFYGEITWFPSSPKYKAITKYLKERL